MIEDKHLKKAIEYKVGKFSGETLTIDDLLSIGELSLSNYSFSGEKRNINLLELKALPNLRSLDLQYFNIDEDVIRMLNEFEKLDSLQLVSCNFASSESLKNRALRNLGFNSCRIKDYSKIFVPQMLTIINTEKIKLEALQGLENVEILNLQNSTIRGMSKVLECNKLRKLNLDGSVLDDNEIISKLSKRIEISREDKYLPIR